MVERTVLVRRDKYKSMGINKICLRDKYKEYRDKNIYEGNKLH
jgi:hypothetical protein